jgi:hypothetical protein
MSPCQNEQDCFSNQTTKGRIKLKKIAAMFLGLSMLVGTASLFADDAAKDTTKTKKAKTKAKPAGKKRANAKKTTEEKK